MEQEQSGTAIVLAAHGSSRDERINQPMFALARQIKNLTEFAFVTPAFLDGQPNLRSIVDEIEQRHVIVIPFMASAGYYTDVVFPQCFASDRLSVRITDAIGVHPILPDLVSCRIDAVLDGFEKTDDWTIVLVGHGTRKNRKSCRTTIDLARNLRSRNAKRRIQFAFLDQNPSLEHVAANIATSHLLIVPFLMGLGPHTTVDVPSAFGIGPMAAEVSRLKTSTQIRSHTWGDCDGYGFEFPVVQQVADGAGPTRTIVYDAPIGIYPEWAAICVDIALSWTAPRSEISSIVQARRASE